MSVEFNRMKGDPDNRGVLVIYTGGTIGSAPRDREDADSPQVVVSWEELRQKTQEISRLEGQGCRVNSVVLEPKDSCNVGPKDWAQMAQTIFDNYDEYEGFVILHGTDTMVYSACALSFMLQDLGKPVVLTGAQRSALVDVRNDATQNLITSILVANPRFSRIPVIPEVVIFFGGSLLRGNRTIKDDTSGYRAYRSPNFEPLGEVGDRIVINERIIRDLPSPGRRFRVRTSLEHNVMPLFVYPGIPAEHVEQRLSLPGLRAVIVHAFGSGNIPTQKELIDCFRRARSERGILLAIVSQCRRGPVELGIYETSAELLETGFVAASDLSIEAAQCKLMTLLGHADAKIEEVEKDYQISIAGEQTYSKVVTEFDVDVIEAAARDDAVGRVRLPECRLEGNWHPSAIDRALLRLRGGKIFQAANQPVSIRLYANLDPEEELRADALASPEPFRKWPVDRSGLIVFDLTRTMRAIARPGDRLSITIVVESANSVLSARAAEMVLFTHDNK